MENTRRRNRRVVTITAALAVALGSVGVATATIPDSGGVINACYKSKKGAVRVIDAPSVSCVTGETQLWWKTSGPQGPQGAPGAQGTAGPSGPAGPQGGSGISSTEFITQLHDVPNNGNDTANLSCPGGKHVIAGGYYNQDSVSIVITENRPSGFAGIGWTVSFHNNDLFSHHTVTAYAVCSNVG
jgi:hypothetical protein